MNKLEILEVIELVRYLPNSPINGPERMDSIIKLYTAVLSDLPADMVRAATLQYLSEGTPFFPLPGTIRTKALDLQLLALGLPTPAEAWGMVLTAVSASSRWCEEGARLRESSNDPAQYWNAVLAYRDHVNGCELCNVSGLGENYRHPAVAETVNLLGGRDVILTDNPAADRARFIEAYREVIERERMKLGMLPAVSNVVEQLKPIQAIGLLTERLNVRKELTGFEDARRAALDRGRGEQ